MKRAKSSTMKLVPKIRPFGMTATIAAAAINSRIEHRLTALSLRSRKAPSRSNAMAPSVSTISGRAWVIDASGMAFTARASLHQRGGFRRAKRMLVVVEQRRHGRRRHVEHGLRIEAEQQGQHDQRRE